MWILAEREFYTQAGGRAKLLKLVRGAIERPGLTNQITLTSQPVISDSNSSLSAPVIILLLILAMTFHKGGVKTHPTFISLKTSPFLLTPNQIV